MGQTIVRASKQIQGAPFIAHMFSLRVWAQSPSGECLSAGKRRRANTQGDAAVEEGDDDEGVGETQDEGVNESSDGLLCSRSLENARVGMQCKGAQYLLSFVYR